MSNLLLNLVIHVTDTPFGRVVTKDDLFFWHCFPRLNSNGTVTYKGKTYKNVQALPDEYYIINNQKLSIKKHTSGRGWSIEGYSDLIETNGKLTNINPYNPNQFVDNWEVTNGVAGHNSKSRHVVLAGGWTKDGRKAGKFEPEEIFSPEQIQQLIDYIKMMKEMWPGIKIVGHYELDNRKTCPNFDVPKFLKQHNL